MIMQQCCESVLSTKAQRCGNGVALSRGSTAMNACSWLDTLPVLPLCCLLFLQWRKGSEQYKELCNRCGMHYSRHKNSPETLFSEKPLTWRAKFEAVSMLHLNPHAVRHQ